MTEKVMMSFRIEESLLEKIKEIAEKEKRSVSNQINFFLDKAVNYDSRN